MGARRGQLAVVELRGLVVVNGVVLGAVGDVRRILGHELVLGAELAGGQLLNIVLPHLLHVLLNIIQVGWRKVLVHALKLVLEAEVRLLRLRLAVVCLRALPARNLIDEGVSSQRVARVVAVLLRGQLLRGRLVELVEAGKFLLRPHPSVDPRKAVVQHGVRVQLFCGGADLPRLLLVCH